MKIGIYGESPNDTKAIIAILQKRHKALFVTLLDNMTGSKMLSEKAFGLFKSAVQEEDALNLIIAIRDLDASPSETEKLNEIQSWFKRLEKLATCPTLLLVNIQELEALLLIDTTVINREYSCNIKAIGNPEHQPNPKDLIQSKTGNSKTKRRYETSDAPKLFAKLDYESLLNIPYFKSFHRELHALINPKPTT